LKLVGQQGLPVVELELNDKDAIQVTAPFFAESGFIGNVFYCRIQSRPVFGMQLLTARAKESVVRVAKSIV